MRRLGGLVLLISAVALASPSPELTQEFEAGVDAYRLGNLAEARAHLDKAHALDPSLPGPERYLAAVAEAQGRWQDCIDAARLALQLNPQSAELAETRRLHDGCRASAGRAPYRGELGAGAAIDVATSVPGASVTIGGLGFGATPFPPRRISPGSLELVIAKQGYQSVRVKVDALPGIVTDVRVELVEDPAAAAPTRPLVTVPAQVHPARGCCEAGEAPGSFVITSLALVLARCRRRAASKQAS